MSCSAYWASFYFFFLVAQQLLVGQGLPLRGLTITLRRTTLGRSPLDEWSVRRRDLYLTTHNTHNRQTPMHTARFKTTVPGSERPQTHALDRAATRIDVLSQLKPPYGKMFKCSTTPFAGLDHWHLEDEVDTFLRNVGDHLTSDAASHDRRPESPIKSLLQPQNLACRMFVFSLCAIFSLKFVCRNEMFLSFRISTLINS